MGKPTRRTQAHIPSAVTLEPAPARALPPLERPNLWSCMLIAAMLLLTSIAFAPVVNYGFVAWDDPKYVEHNDTLQALSLRQIDVQAHTLVMGNYHPATMLSYALDILLAGEKDPAFMHRTNLLLHGLGSLLVALFAWLLTGRSMLAAISALLFAIHPFRAETIGWISDRKDLLMLVFGMAMLICYLLFLRRKRTAWLVSTFVCFLLACLSKGMAVSLAPTLVLLDLYAGRTIKERALWFEKLPFLVVAFGFGVLAVHAQVETATVEDAADLALGGRLVLAASSLAIYLFQSIVPLGLCARYDYPDLTDGIPVLHLFLAAATIGFAWCVFVFRRQRLLVFGSLFFLVNIALVLQLFQVGSMVRADRYTYLSGVGAALVLAWALTELARLVRAPGLVLPALALAYAATLGYFARERITVWSDPMAVWDDMIQGNPDSPTPYVSRAATYYMWGRFPEAIVAYDKALSLDPTMLMVRYDRGVAMVENGRYADGMKDLLKVFEARVKAPPALLQNMIYATMKLGRYQEAGANATAALKLDSNALFLYNMRAYCGLQLGQWRAADADIAKALSLDSTSADAQYLKGCSMLAKGDTVGACLQLANKRTAALADRDLRQERTRLLATVCHVDTTVVAPLLP